MSWINVKIFIRTHKATLKWDLAVQQLALLLGNLSHQNYGSKTVVDVVMFALTPFFFR